jgi:hypothetical protein
MEHMGTTQNNVDVILNGESIVTVGLGYRCVWNPE